MTYSSNETGGATFTLSPAEHAAFKAGKPVVKITGSSQGMASITLKMTHPRSRSRRYPTGTYGEGYKPPKNPVSASITLNQETGAHGEMHKVIVDGTTMVHGPGHLTAAKAAEWIEIYRKINPDLPEGSIRTENTYFPEV